MSNLEKIKKELKNLSNPEQAKNSQKFFKTRKGEYGEKDVFLGVKVPIQRWIITKYKNFQLSEIKELLNSKIHEYRFIALLLLIDKYKKSNNREKKKFFDFYLRNTKNVNNWDLVDLSAPKIIGDYLLNKPRDILYKLVKSKNLWEKRIAIIATFIFIKNNDFKDILKISKILLNDKNDLIHKAIGWMLREVGKQNQEVEEKFLNKYHKRMPRIMLRYSIEKFNEEKRKAYLKK
ncbi:MAG: DNA alkylation repair protein [Xanthomonadaceae bacterium]|nr:DNA alkylation repair protein [Rhodospirillaceae bacterium]NIA18008.1 DNA alkylation repair protein [Xanthomonadaceae bacterium]